MASLESKNADIPKENDVEPAQNFFSGFLKNLLKKRSLQIGAVILIISILAISHFLSGKDKKKDEVAQLQKGEEREVYKEKNLKRIIENAETGKTEGRAKIKPPGAKGEKRNYATDMAVFVFERKEKNNERAVKPSPEREKAEKLGLPPGAKIPAHISGTLFSFNTEAPVTAVVSKDIEKDGKIVIPKNSRFLGEADVLKSLDRINVRFRLLVFPDGTELKARAMALSCDGSSGIKGRVSKHRDMRVFKAIGETMLAGASLFAGGLSSEAFSLEDELRLNLAQGLTNEARQDLRNVNVDTSITVEGYTPVQVLLLEGM